MPDGKDDPIAFPLGSGGPFFRLQVKLRLVRGNPSPVVRRIVFALLITWLPLCLLWWWQPQPPQQALQHTTWSDSLLTHISTYVRFFITVPLLILAENAVRPPLERAFRQAITSGAIPPAQRDRFYEMLLNALEYRESKLAEVIMFVLALVTAQLSVSLLRDGGQQTWIYSGHALTWAGIWYICVSLPLLQFLIFRWFYRLLIWWRVMQGIARLDLEIKPAHPDRRGGLAFLGDSIQAFALLALAFSASGAGAVADFLVSAGATVTELKGFIAGLALFILLLFLVPMLFFIGPLTRAKEAGLLSYEALAHRYLHAFDGKWTRTARSWPSADRIEEPDFSTLTDLVTVVQGVRDMQIIPLTRQGLLPLLLAIVLPFIPVLASAIPLQDMVSGILHVFLGG